MGWRVQPVTGHHVLEPRRVPVGQVVSADLQVTATLTWLIAGEMVGLIRKRVGRIWTVRRAGLGGLAGDAPDVHILTNGGSRA